MTYEDLKVLSDIVNTKYSYYNQHGNGKECEVIKEIVSEFIQNAESSKADKKDGLSLFNF